MHVVEERFPAACSRAPCFWLAANGAVRPGAGLVSVDRDNQEITPAVVIIVLLHRLYTPKEGQIQRACVLFSL